MRNINIQATINVDLETVDLRLYIPDLTDNYVHIVDRTTKQFFFGAFSKKLEEQLNALNKEYIEDSDGLEYP